MHNSEAVTGYVGEVDEVATEWEPGSTRTVSSIIGTSSHPALLSPGVLCNKLLERVVRE